MYRSVPQPLRHRQTDGITKALADHTAWQYDRQKRYVLPIC